MKYAFGTKIITSKDADYLIGLLKEELKPEKILLTDDESPKGRFVTFYLDLGIDKKGRQRSKTILTLASYPPMAYPCEKYFLAGPFGSPQEILDGPEQVKKLDSLYQRIFSVTERFRDLVR